MDDPIDRLRDEVARQDEHSHVDSAVRERIGEVVLEVEHEPLEETARRIVGRLSDEELAPLVADWLGRADGDLARLPGPRKVKASLGPGR